jgi:hypothetical protein
MTTENCGNDSSMEESEGGAERVISNNRTFSFLMTNFKSRAEHHAEHLETTVGLLSSAIWPTHTMGTMVPNIRENEYGRGCKFKHNGTDYYAAYDDISAHVQFLSTNRNGRLLGLLSDNNIVNVKQACNVFMPAAEARLITAAMRKTLKSNPRMACNTPAELSAFSSARSTWLSRFESFVKFVYFPGEFLPKDTFENEAAFLKCVKKNSVYLYIEYQKLSDIPSERLDYNSFNVIEVN